MPEHYDLIVLGAGSAARDAAQKAIKEHGARVAMAERVRWGGSCPNVACKPTKQYLVVADLVHDVNTLGAELGIEVREARVNLAKVKARKVSIQRSQEGWVELIRNWGVETYQGVATFTGPRALRVGGRELTADRVLVATGSRTAVPPIPGIDEIDWIDHVSALELEQVPSSLVVLGGGPVGLELGQIFARFGSAVTIVNGGPHMAARSDRQAAEELQAALEDEGIRLVHNARAAAVRNEDGEVVVTLESGEEHRAARLLLASGRSINVEDLNLEAAGVEHTERAIAVDEYMRTTADGVWAAGDVTGIQFTPVAQYQARIAVDDMFGLEARPADYAQLPTAIFTDPEIAGVGLTEEEARAKGGSVDAVVHPLRYITRAQFTNAKHGLYKIVFDAQSRRVLGIHVVTRGASDVVQGLAIALELGVTVDDLAHSHHTYPTYGEGIKAAAEQALVRQASPA
jgi:mercuric reductase